MKKEKETRQQALLSIEIHRRNDMEQKRKTIAEKKIKEVKGLKVSQGRIKNDKIKEYKKAIIQKRKLIEIKNNNNNKTTQFNKAQIDKIKNEREKNKKILDKKRKNQINKINNSYKLTYQINLNETEKLKNELIKLEKVEEQYLEKLDYSRDSIRQSHLDIKRKINDIDIKESDKVIAVKRNANSVMKRYNINDNNNLSRNKNDKSSSLLNVENKD